MRAGTAERLVDLGAGGGKGALGTRAQPSYKPSDSQGRLLA